MTLSRTWPSGIALHQESFSYEWNALDAMQARMVDKRGDTILGTIALNGCVALVGGFLTIQASGVENLNGTTSSVVFGSSGLTITPNAPNSSAMQVTSGAQILVTGAGSTLKTKLGGRISLGDNDYFTFSSPRTFTREIDLAYQPAGVNGTGWTPGTAGDGIVGPAATSAANIVAILPENMPPNGATITRVDVYFTPAIGRTAVAANQPAIALQTRTVAAGAALPTRTNTASGSASLTLDAYNSGKVQTLSLTGLSVTVDSTQTQYSVRIMDENGSGAIGGTVFHKIRLTYTMSQLSFR